MNDVDRRQKALALKAARALRQDCAVLVFVVPGHPLLDAALLSLASEALQRLLLEIRLSASELLARRDETAAARLKRLDA